MAEIEFRDVAASERGALQSFLAETSWAERVADAERFRRMIENADRSIVAISGGRIVGFARALCDDASNGYISMLAVAPEFRRRGIGRELVKRVTGDDPHITWVLRAGRGSAPFWERIGFAHSEIAMERVRRDSSTGSNSEPRT